jgi:phage terminase large subunit
MGWSKEFHCIKSPLEITHKKTGNKIIARGLDDAEKLKSLDDPTVVWVEEATEVDEVSFVKLDTSIRSSKPNTLKQMIITFNPEEEEHFVNSRFFPPKVTYEKEDGSHTYIKSVEPKTLILHSTYEHNDYLCEEDKETITRLERAYGKESNYYKVYVRGLWGNALKGRIFENVNFVSAFPDRANCKKYGYGLDFGFTNDPTALIECALAHGALWFRVATHKTALHNRKNPNKLGDPSIESELERNEVTKSTDITADCAEPKSISEIKSCGYQIKGVNKSKDTVEGSLMQMKGYEINIVNSPTMEKEAKNYKYKLDKEGEPTNEPIDAWNHDWDAARYWFMENVMKPKKVARIF